MTSTQWNNLSYYGRKLKKNFLILSRIIENSIAEQRVDEAKITVDTFLKVAARMESTALAVNKMVDTIDTTKRIENIEKLIEAIPVELLAEAKLKIGQ